MRTQGICKVDGCVNKTRMKGKYPNGDKMYGAKCSRHSRSKIGWATRKRQTAKKWIRDLDMNHCTICAWEGLCDKHRIIWGIDGGTYKKGNVIVLCPNCHRLVHHGGLEIQ